MGDWVDPDAGLAEVASLWLADDAVALHRVLVLFQPIRSTFDAFEPMSLLRKHHETEPDASAKTAMLLLTDRRWKGAAGHLIRQVEDSDILGEEELDLFADTFLAADDAVFYPVPEEWWGPEFTLDLGPLEEDEVIEDDEPERPVVARREVWAPLRRWAAARAVRQDPQRWNGLLARANELNARHAAAIVAGLVDGIASLETDAQSALIELAVRWPQNAVRRQGLELVAERDGPDRAYALGKKDPSKAVREWAEGVRGRGTLDNQPEPPAEGDEGGTRRHGKPSDQPTLF
ncbi:hypothetical protein BH23ACT4_BH23ACT4_06610 [soil metagenome]